MTCSCHSVSCVPVMLGKRWVIGTGSGRPSRRAMAVAVASTAEESRPPEKLTSAGDRRSAGRIACLEGAARGRAGLQVRQRRGAPARAGARGRS